MIRKPRTLDEHIADMLRDSHERGELQRARGFGKPFDFADGYDEAPADLRMGFKILKDAGAVPLEVAMMQDIQALEDRLSKLEPECEEAVALRRRIAGLRVEVALRLEAMGRRPRA